jgi:serine/threonine-protein kinase
MGLEYQPPVELELGRTIGNYRLLSVLGRGGMGSVYYARHVILGREVAVKVLSETLHHDPHWVARFRLEAQIFNSVRHKSVIEVIDYVETESPRVMAYVMEYVSGRCLTSILERRRLRLDEAANVLDQVADAIAAAHAVGIVHRDLKPDNILIAGDDDRDLSEATIKILDFGIAKAPTGVNLTAPGIMLGTPAYMAPEQIAGAPVSSATDVYALAEILYEVLTARRLFDADSAMTILLTKLDEDASRLCFPGLEGAERVAALIRSGMQRDPSRRPTLADFRDSLRALAATERAPAPRAVSPAHRRSPSRPPRPRSAFRFAPGTPGAPGGPKARTGERERAPRPLGELLVALGSGAFGAAAGVLAMTLASSGFGPHAEPAPAPASAAIAAPSEELSSVPPPPQLALQTAGPPGPEAPPASPTSPAAAPGAPPRPLETR